MNKEKNLTIFVNGKPYDIKTKKSIKKAVIKAIWKHFNTLKYLPNTFILSITIIRKDQKNLYSEIEKEMKEMNERIQQYFYTFENELKNRLKVWY